MKIHPKPFLLCVLSTLVGTAAWADKDKTASVCDSLSGGQKGLCTAYCEANHCQSDNPSASPTACSKIKTNFQKHAGAGALFPCEVHPATCGAEADAQIVEWILWASTNNITISESAFEGGYVFMTNFCNHNLVFHINEEMNSEVVSPTIEKVCNLGIPTPPSVFAVVNTGVQDFSHPIDQNCLAFIRQKAGL